MTDRSVIMIRRVSAEKRCLETSLGEVVAHVTGSGPAVVLLHANPGSSRDYEAVIGPLAHHHQVIALDWPGYGDSAAPRQSDFAGAVSYARVLVELLDVLGQEGQGSQDGQEGQDGREAHARFVLIGNSVGGYAALRAAAARPGLVAGLVLVAPGGFTRMNPLTRSLCRLIGTAGFGGRLAGPLARVYLRRRNPVTRRAIAEAGALRASPSRLAVHRSVWRSFTLAEHDLRQISAPGVPLLLQWGRWDPILPLISDGRRAARVLSTTLNPFATGHEPYAEAPREWLDAVEPFLWALRDGEKWSSQPIG
jgi:pimeloyl-ACP methyl ester carboxylesterase